MNYVREKPEALIMDITPEIANEMLKTSPGNRKTRGWYVKLLSSAMKRGEFRVTSQGIGFNKNGELRDAHHRLKACIDADVSFPSLVVLGLNEDVYEVIDTGIARTYADRLNIDKSIAEVVRLGCDYALGTRRPTIDQMKPFIEGGFIQAVQSITDFCGSKRRFYSSAPMKLGAVVTIMNGGNADYVMQQYRALCLLDFDSMSRTSMALVKQVNYGKITGTETREVLARAVKVFDKERENLAQIRVTEFEINAAVELVKSVLLSII